MFKMCCGDCGECWYIGNPRTCKCPDETKQEPYGYLKLSNGKFYVEVVGVPDLDCNPDYLPLHTHPQPKREWVRLTLDELIELSQPFDGMLPEGWMKLASAIEAKLKEKNT